MNAINGQDFSLVIFLLFSIPACAADIKHNRIPNQTVYPAILILTALKLICRIPFSAFLPGLFAGALIFYAIRVFTGGKMGMGDVKFAALMGLFNGFPYWFTAVFIASLTALIFILPGIVTGRIHTDTKIPFAPFLTAGSIMAYAAAGRFLF